jgi:hypothetical protein
MRQIGLGKARAQRTREPSRGRSFLRGIPRGQADNKEARSTGTAGDRVEHLRDRGGLEVRLGRNSKIPLQRA